MVELFTALPRPVAGLRKAGAIGDSITADAFTNGLWTNWGWLAWARRYLADRIDLPGSRMWAVSGKTVAQVLSEQLPSALAADLDICFVHCGTNSLGGTTATIIADLTSIYAQLLAVGTLVVAIPIRAHKSPDSITGDNLLQMAAINRFIAEYARTRPGMLVVDANPGFLDFATGDVKSTYLRDGIHDNLLSAKAMGRQVADVVSAVIPAWDDRFTHLGDTYDATKNPRGNLLLNGLMAGTAGSEVNGATGDTATSWRLGRSANSGTLTVAGSKTTHGTYATLAKQRITVGGTATGPFAFLDQERTIAAMGVSVADVLQGEVEVDYNLTSADFAGIALHVKAMDTGFATLAESYDGYYSASNGLMAAETSSAPLILRSDLVTVPANTVYVTVRVLLIAPSSGDPVGVIDVTRASLRKIV